MLTPTQKDQYKYVSHINERITYEEWAKKSGHPVTMEGDGSYSGGIFAQHDFGVWLAATDAFTDRLLPEIAKLAELQSDLQVMSDENTKLEARVKAAEQASRWESDICAQALESLKEMTAERDHLRATLANKHRSQDIETFEAAVREYIDEYEMLGETPDGRDAYYTPNENDKALLLDAFMGFDFSPWMDLSTDDGVDEAAFLERFEENVKKLPEMLATVDTGVKLKLPCNIPRKGWVCTRESGHDGPCAAVPQYER